MKYTKGIFFILGLLLLPALSGALPMGSRLCKDTENYTCYTVKKNDTWQSLFPSSYERDLVMRVNRLNNTLYRGQRIAIPNSLRGGLDAFAPFPDQISPPGKKLIIVSINPNTLAWARMITRRPCAMGPSCWRKRVLSDTGTRCNTALGTYSIQSKQGSNCVSTKFPIGKGGAPMPWCMFYYRGFALHGSYDVPGYNASHGCIRLFISDAEWLNRNFVSDDPVSVIITNKTWW